MRDRREDAKDAASPEIVTSKWSENIQKLFHEFERIEEKRNRNIEGTGLGMNITQKLLALMGTSLQVESVYGEGSRFSLRLKQRVVKWDPIGNYEEAYRRPDADEEMMEDALEELRCAAEDEDSDRLMDVFAEMNDYRIPGSRAKLWEALSEVSENGDYEEIGRTEVPNGREKEDCGDSVPVEHRDEIAAAQAGGAGLRNRSPGSRASRRGRRRWSR